MYLDPVTRHVSHRTHIASVVLHLLKTTLSCCLHFRISSQEEKLKDAFERLDVDSTGFISRDNLKVVLGKTYDNSLIDKMLEVRLCWTLNGNEREEGRREGEQTYRQ